MDRAEPITAATSEGSSRGPSIPRLPVEVCGRIIDHVAMGMNLRDYFVEDEPHLAALSSYALVCRDWYYLTWYHLRQRIHLRDREDVLSLSKTLPTKPRLRKVIQHVVISGASPGWRRRRPIRHLGTFVAMLAGKAPMLSRISIEDAQWTIDSVRMEDIHFITTFSSMNTLTLRNVTLSSITQLSRLVSALPRLRELWCSRVNCLREQQLSLASLPLNCANLYALSVSLVSPAVEDLLVCISRASQVRSLHFGVNGELAPPGAASRSQALLVASSTSAERVVLDWDIDRSSIIRDGTVDTTVERHCNLSHHDHLWELSIQLYHPFSEWPWIPYILSHVTSKHFQAMSVRLVPWSRTTHMADDFLNTMEDSLDIMKDDNALVRLDSILQEERFASTVICMDISEYDNTRESGDGNIAKVSILRERWDEFVRRRMPHSHRRGILITTHTSAEFGDWQRDTERRHTSMSAEQTNTEGEAQPQGHDDSGARGDTD